MVSKMSFIFMAIGIAFLLMAVIMNLPLLIFILGTMVIVGIQPIIPIITESMDKRKWPVAVLIHELRGDKEILFWDRMKQITVDKATKTMVWQLKAKKDKIKPMDYKFLQLDRKGNLFLELYSPTKSEYHGMLPSPKNLQITATLDPDLKGYQIDETKKQLVKYANKGINATMIAIMMFIVVVIVLGVYTTMIMDAGNKNLDTINEFTGRQLAATEQGNKVNQYLAEALLTFSHRFGFNLTNETEFLGGTTNV